MIQFILAQAVKDDVIQLQEPISTASGELVDRIIIGIGSSLIVPIRAINRSEAIWGHDAKEFRPERWLSNEAGLTLKSKEIPGYHHVLSFIDGPRMCLGKLFAVAEFKVCPISCTVSSESVALDVLLHVGSTERPSP